MLDLKGAGLKIERAKKHIDELDRRMREFSDHDAHTIAVEQHIDTRESLIQIMVAESVPEDFALIIGDAIHNLRSALDIAISDIEFATTGHRKDRTQFPIRETRNELISAINGGLKSKAPESTLNFIVDVVQPYKGGNGDALWALHRLDIDDKHRLLIPYIPSSPVAGVRAEDDRGEKFDIAIVLAVPGRLASCRCIGRRNVNITDKGKVSLSILFGDGYAWAGEPILVSLTNLADYIANVIEGLLSSFMLGGVT